ncbi:inorganic diphosphatase, partial [Klebsiella pneumoniae]|uniref:inorganic diphosphatase n=1 Tax=Klebsiella pneumoniae TaxID=573 RepID=UPI003B286C79
DPTYDDIKTISDLPKIEQQRLEAFFRVYKELPEGRKKVELAGDGDPLDVVFYTRAPMAPGTLIKLRAIGVLKMIDGGEKDDKIIAVPASKIDPTYDDIKTISDLPKIEQQRLEAFFRVYKELPEGRKKVELAGFNDAAAAKQEIKSAWEAWKAKNPQ